MTVRANIFTPRILLSASRRSAGIPDPTGKLVLYTETQYDYDQHKGRSSVKLLDIANGETVTIAEGDGIQGICWLGDSAKVLVWRTKEGDTSETEIVVGEWKRFADSQQVVATVDAAISELKITTLPAEKGQVYGIALAAPASTDGTLFNAKKQTKAYSTGRLYSSLFVRHWDHWITPQRNAVWYAELREEVKSSAGASDSLYTLSPLVNVLKGTNLECPIDQPGRSGDFDIGPRGLVFISKDPIANPATHTKCQIYVVPLKSFQETSPTLCNVDLSSWGMHGAMSSPVFTASGRGLAFLVMREDGYESDKNHIFAMADINNPSSLLHLPASDDPKESWNRSPLSLKWDHHNSLYLTAEHHGRAQLYKLPDIPNYQGQPQILPYEGSISDVVPLKDGTVFASASTFVDNSVYVKFSDISSTASPLEAAQSEIVTVSSNSRQGQTLGLSLKQVTEIWFQGASGNQAELRDGQVSYVHAWVLKPSSFDKNKKYPLAMLVHGGPQGAWMNSWSTRWNPMMFAEQGYVVVCPNPTGSTGYGQDFCDAIQENWGGLPYQDLEYCFDYVAKNLDYVDTSKAVALGASYGGYMMNWIQGHDLGKKFKALVCHDGIFSTISGGMASEELYFPTRDLGGLWPKNKEIWQRWDPAQYTDRWTTPMLVVHSDLDYRLTMAEGLAAFNVLQTRGVESQLLYFPDENHFVLKPENALKWLSAMVNFTNKFVGLPAYEEGNLDDIVMDPRRTSTV